MRDRTLRFVDFLRLMGNHGFDRLIRPLHLFIKGEHEQEPETNENEQRHHHPDHPRPPAARHQICK